ncbi:TetR/AcrR family transcriptional regulator [Aurantivibrio plasticivorans]
MTQSDSPRPRRTNAERSAETIEKILEAAIKCIYDAGYAGTSINSVALIAGVSKGAAQHHFANKAELMLSVAKRCLEIHNQIRWSVYSKYPPGSQRIEQSSEASWEVVNDPSYTALIEIMMASRNDEELRNGMTPILETIYEERQRGVDMMCEEFNLERTPLVETLIRTHVTALRGIAIGLMFNPDKDAFREELAMMQRYENAMRHYLEKEYPKKNVDNEE